MEVTFGTPELDYSSLYDRRNTPRIRVRFEPCHQEGMFPVASTLRDVGDIKTDMAVNTARRARL